ncbi:MULTISPECIES: RHS repeat protein [unclassified Paenibacillus]|uniref:RHS repeat protein n=1 Tax=unclassified Paenibacillus TaxID=185978 RepID=UPI0015A47411|nr:MULTISPECIES: RHS repeat protein [unclassified Paenibacillus]
MAATSNFPTTYDELAVKRMNLKVNDAPYSVGGNENVSTISGALQVENVDMTIPGRNGLSFSLKRRYNSNDATYYNKDVFKDNVYELKYYPELKARLYYKFTGERVTQIGTAPDFGFEPFWYYRSYLQYKGTFIRWDYPNDLPTIQDYNEFREKLEKNTWPYVDPDDPNSIPHITKEDIYTNSTYLMAKAFTTGNVFVFPDSRKTVCLHSTIYGCVENLYAYGNKTVDKEEEENRFALGKGWSWDLPYIEFKNYKGYLTLFGGTTYELDGTKLKGYPWNDLTLDYDNTVTVNGLKSYYVLKNLDGKKQFFSSGGKLLQILDTYNNTIQFEYSHVSPYGSVLTKVRDAIGNEIQITYSTAEVILTQGDRRVTYTKTKDSQQNKELLSQVTDAQGRTTSYVYETAIIPFDLVGGAKPKDNYVALLKQIYHPTKARTDYSYQSFSRSLGKKATESVYRIQSREDVMTYASGAEEKYNHIDYIYQGDGTEVRATDFSFSTTIDNGRQKTTFTYFKNYIDDDTPEVIYNTQIKQDDGTIQRIQDMEYDRGNRRTAPIKITSYTKKGTEQSTSQIVTRVYDNYANVTSETSPDQVTTTYTYDEQTHLLKSVLSPLADGLSSYTEIERYPSYNSIKNAKVRENNASGNLLAETGYTYDAYGNPATVAIKDDSRNVQIDYEYGTVYGSGFPTKQTIETTNADGQKSTIIQDYQFNKQTGQMTKLIDGNRHTTEYAYDKLGRMLSVKNPDGSLQTITYNDSENMVTETDPTNVKVITRWNPLGLKTHVGIEGKSTAMYGYDPYGRLEWAEDGEGHRTTYQYDKWDRVMTTLLPGGASATTQYDDIHRTVTETDPEGYSSKQWLDLMGRVTKKESYSKTGALTSSSQMSYTLAGQVKVVDEGIATEASGITQTQYEYDAMGRVKSVLNGMQEKTSYTYSLAGQLTKVHYPDGNELTKHYDEMGRLIRRVDPAGQAERYYYDHNSNMTKKIDRNGYETTYVYDNRNFLDKMTTTDEVIQFTQDTAGRRLTMQDGTGTTSYSYESGSGWLTEVKYPDQKRTTYTYDAQGNRTQMTDPFDQVTEYRYDARNRLEHVGSNPAQWDATYTYKTNNQPDSIQLLPGLTSTWGYETLKSTLTHVQPGQGTLRTYQYTYNLKGDQTVRVENGQSHSFGYDKLSRIQTSSEYQENYTYDNRGNRQTLQSVKPLMLSDQSYTYDKKNRLIAASGHSGSTVSYKYNGDGLLTERTENGSTTRYYYDGSNIIAEGQVSGGVVTRKASYIRGNQLVARVDAAGTKMYYMHNGHGDVVGLVNAAGQVVNSYTYDIWGNPVTTQETVAQPFRYSGEFWDSSTGLQYLRARWYDPSVGRFINEDTYEGDISNPLSLNLYTYVSNNPLRYTDPTGHEAFDYNQATYLANTAATGSGNYQWALGYILKNTLLDDNQARYLLNTAMSSDDAGTSAWAKAQLKNNSHADWILSLNRSIQKNMENASEEVQFMSEMGPVLGGMGYFGANGTQVTSKTLWKDKGTKARIDVENPNPGQRPGQIHYQDENNTKYLFSPEKGKFVDSSGNIAPRGINDMLKNTDFVKKLNVGLEKYLGESPYTPKK